MIDKETTLKLARESGMSFHLGLPHEAVMKQLQAFANSVATATVSRLAAGVSVEPFAYTDPLFVSVRQLGGFFTASNDKVGMFTVPLYTATAIAAARVQENERCAKVCDAVPEFFRGSKDMHPLHVREVETAQGLAVGIRALLGGPSHG